MEFQRLCFISGALSFLAYIRLGDALKCLNCDNVAHPALCKHVTTCYSGEECGMNTFISSDGARLYSLGCYDTHFCAAGASLHAGSSQAFYSCQTCCNDHDLCNIRGCNTTGFPENRGPVCYSCEASPAGFNCPTIEYCEGHEVCYSEATLEFLTETFYSSGCRSKHHCAGNSFDPLTSFIGKRHASSSKTNANPEPADVYKRSLKVCTDCCGADLCNIQCKQSDACNDDSYCSTLMASIPDICLNQGLAEKFCQRTCNLCPSLSTSSCGDLRVDCAHINQTTCGSYVKAYTSGCLKHCGFCSGSTGPPTVPIVTSFVLGTTQPVTNAPSTTIKTSTMRPTTTRVPSTATPTTTSTIRTTSTTSTVSTTTHAASSSFKTTPTPQSTTMTPTVVMTDTTTTPGFTFPLHPVFIHRTTAPNPPATVVPVSRVYTNGSRVQRGSDWKGGNEDLNGTGTIVDTSIPGVVTVIWDNGNTHSYNMGKDGKYELAVISILNSTTSTLTRSTTGLHSTGTPVSSPTVSTSTSLSPITSPVATTSSPLTRSTIGPQSTGTPVSSPTVSTSTSPAAITISSVTSHPLNTVKTTDVTTSGPMSTVTVKANCQLTPPNVTHGFPTEVNHDVILYRCYAGYIFELSSPNNSRKVYCDSTSQTWTKPLPTCIAKSLCTDSTDCLRDGTCDMTSHYCKCAPGFFNTNCDTTLQNGDLVVRGPDWRWGDQDGNSTGKVIPTLTNQNGWVRIQWANNAFENSYRFGIDGKYDIIPYNSSYIVPNLISPGSLPPATIVSGTTTTAVPTYGPALLAKMSVGDRVKRGRDWKWGDQDSNGFGTVASINRSGGWVLVEWDSGLRNQYRMGSEGAYDLMLAP